MLKNNRLAATKEGDLRGTPGLLPRERLGEHDGRKSLPGILSSLDVWHPAPGMAEPHLRHSRRLPMRGSQQAAVETSLQTQTPVEDR
jgi:hypothetical protein